MLLQMAVDFLVPVETGFIELDGQLNLKCADL